MSMEKNDGIKIPEHIAIILDGNGRWAKKRLLPRNAGHAAGAKNLEKVVEAASDMGVKYVTVYAFSTENWNRPEDEVRELMRLLRNYLEDSIEKSMKNNMKVCVIGDRKGLDDDIVESIERLEEVSGKNTGICLIIALNYGSRDELRRAFTSIAGSIREGTIDPDDITEEMISSHLDTKGVPDPDLLIRTSGEQRLSNYMLWQLAYTEFYFTDTYWPDFDEKELEKAVLAYNKRDRRYGGIK